MIWRRLLGCGRLGLSARESPSAMACRYAGNEVGDESSMTLDVTQTLPSGLANPKRRAASAHYDYYAAYSSSFVRDVLSYWPRHSLILDPWNGSGTTTTVAAELGFQCVGIDLNPAMIAIARSQLMDHNGVSSVRHRAHRTLAKPLPQTRLNLDDPLLQWFDEPTVTLFRRYLKGLTGFARLTNQSISRLRPHAAFWFTALFRLARSVTQPWHTTNPTWIKSGGSLPVTTVPDSSFQACIRTASRQATAICGTRQPTARVSLGTSLCLEHLEIQPDLILGSPPYCTRIDYAVATRIELSVLGLSASDQDSLRKSLLGTTTVPPTHHRPSNPGQTGSQLLQAISVHPSKASRTYYSKWFAQYLNNYSNSLAQLATITHPHGTICLVVQDSYYKNLHLDLRAITTDIMATHHWLLTRCETPTPTNTFGDVNPLATAYRNGKRPKEHILFFQKG